MCNNPENSRLVLLREEQRTQALSVIRRAAERMDKRRIGEGSFTMPLRILLLVDDNASSAPLCFALFAFHRT